ncbi:Beta-glucosidase/6-phospho-beta-glucosidase/beta-galactosidase [Dyadobacter sp. SG02]|uniref:amine oxidase n=1 Tax=Dyadobacter sp. SG02 TaxID=1855291 RepID=UPI0008BDF29B|nr:amine oxidase [Dyadobacter sp. SG02]SEJ38769.1 Beta-glucosidase/6-phospho-beta-glucosidase/beta-galactosidase [Dyadobacter sp. SG02]
MRVEEPGKWNRAFSSASPFRTFWMAGFECADQLNASGNRVDMLEMTAHLELIHDDYARISALGLKTVREGIRWSVVEKEPFRYDFSYVLEMIHAARAGGIQQIWDICHFGFPDDLTPFHPQFTDRFVALCKAFTTFYIRHNPGEILYVTPINEVSFLSWLGGEVGGTVPYCHNSGWQVKYALMRAYIAAAIAMKEISDLVKIITTEPLVNMVPVTDPTPEEQLLADAEHEQQFQSVDMLCGRICPELGGNPGLVDILGFNYYYNNQWIVGGYAFLDWNDPLPDPRWQPLANLLEAAYLRYGKPILLSETSHPGEDRPLWIRMVATQCADVITRGVPLVGICLYPVIDRPDWDHPHVWHHSGIWDTDSSGKSARVPHSESVAALLLGQQLINTLFSWKI